MLLVSTFVHRFTEPRLQQGFAILAGCVSIGMIIRQIQNLL